MIDSSKSMIALSAIEVQTRLFISAVLLQGTSTYVRRTGKMGDTEIADFA